VIPSIPISSKAVLTSSILKCLIIASIFFIIHSDRVADALVRKWESYVSLSASDFAGDGFRLQSFRHG
jgi:hypothetical protein